MLRTSLKTIYYYDLVEENQSWPFDFEICVADAAETVMQESIAYLPKRAELTTYPYRQSSERYQHVRVDNFLAAFH